MEQNKKGKYFKYAIGEIAIVTIGILLVLAANFVKEQINEKEFKINALHALKNDVAKDLNELESYWVPRLKKQSEARNRLSEFLETSLPITDSIQFLTDIILVSTYFTFNQNSTAIEDLINSNKFNLIDNDSLRKSLLNYKNIIKGISESDIIHRGYFTEIQGRIGPKLVSGMALFDGFMAYHSNDTATLKIAANKSLNASKIRESDYLRELLIATGPPFEIKKNGYITLASRSEALLRLLDIAIDVE
ncbi:MAG: hypothetical protein JKY69_06430 [Flavobacteriaceae bacterium]|nr:hypothetical protein [Flavobacteriaceae bacterium]